MENIVNQNPALCALKPGQTCSAPRSGRSPPSQLDLGIFRYAVRSYQNSASSGHESSLGKGWAPGTRTHSPALFRMWLYSLYSLLSTVFETKRAGIPFEICLTTGTVLLDSRRRLVKLANVAFRITGATAVPCLTRGIG